MKVCKLSSRRQITLGRELLNHLGVLPGEKVSIEKLPDRSIKIIAQKPGGKLSEFSGSLKSEERASLSIEEMNEAIAAGWAGER